MFDYCVITNVDMYFHLIISTPDNDSSIAECMLVRPFILKLVWSKILRYCAAERKTSVLLISGRVQKMHLRMKGAKTSSLTSVLTTTAIELQD